jgi:predicted protein tyrosine phosphatase
MNILFVCTSNKDTSPALKEYFSFVHNQHEYRSAGINKYFCSKSAGSHYATQEDIDWADVIICAEQVHWDVLNLNFEMNNKPRKAASLLILDCGEYRTDRPIDEDYINRAEVKMARILRTKSPQNL